MSSRSKSAGSKTLSQFDRGPIQILNHFSTLNKSEIISIQLIFFALLEVLSLKLTDNDPIKSNFLFNLIVQFFQSSKLIPTSMGLSAKTIRQSPIFKNYVQIIQQTLQTGLNVIQRPSSTTDGTTITSILENDYSKVLLTTPNLRIDIPQADIQLKVPLALTMNGAITTNDFDNVVIFRYVQDFYEMDKLGKGAFGSVFRARNRLDDRMYAIKKIVFNENTDRTRRQAKCALREVRVLASLSHPNIVQYHCAWLELVPVEPRTRQTPAPTTPQIQHPTVHDSLDDVFVFEKQSSSKDQTNSLQKSYTSQDDDSENSYFSTTNGHAIVHRSHSDGDNPSVSSSKILSQHSTIPNREIVPIEKVHSTNQSNFTNSKIVLFIQMQLCDTTLYDWLRYRDRTIIEETSSDEARQVFYALNELGQRQCWHIFKQLLTAVQYLHSQSFVHRDIKPRNIFLSYDSKDASSVHVKLGDFGLATIFDSGSKPESPEYFESDDSSGVGTALYAPPEQLNSHHCVATAKSDSYSLGIVLFELFNIFPTEMERYCCLSDLRMHMRVGENFLNHYPFETIIIEQLVPIEREKRLNVEELLTNYSREIQQRIKKQQTNTRQMIIEQLEERLRDQDIRIQQLELQLERNNL